jgi:hypothetical protein
MSQPPELRGLPIGVADFADIRDPVENFVFADKTSILHKLLMKPKTPYFLSRPRRFGKTLLVSTLEAILQGRRDLFEERQDESTGRSIGGLWIAGPESDYRFSPGPVISLSLADAASASVEKLESSLIVKLNRIAKREKLELTGINPSDRFGDLIEGLYYKYDGQKVAVL